MAAASEAMRWLSLEQDSPPATVLVEPILGREGLIWGYYIYTQSLAFRLGGESPASRAIGQVVVGGQGVALVVSLLLFWLFGRHLVKPVTCLSAVVGQIAGGDLNARADLGVRDDELGQLARDVDAMAAKLQEARGLAAAAENSRRFTMAALSHDIRTPLTGLLAHAEALRSGISEDVEQSLAVIHEKGLLMKEMLDDLFELAALDADHGRWQRVRLDVAEVVRLAVAGLLPDLERAGLTVEAEIPEEPVWAELPRGKLERVLDNLLSNGRKYGGAGGWLGVRVARVGESIRIEVADLGPGIAAEDQAHVFDRYYRAGTARSGRAQGSGVGLAVAREIVQRLGGRIGVESPPEGGARFWMELPGPEAGAQGIDK